MKKVFLLVLLAIFAIAAYSQTDSTKVKKKKKKIDWVSVHGTVADSFTKMGILDVKTILMKEDSTVIRTSKVYESYGYSSGIGETARNTRYYFSISRKPASRTEDLVSIKADSQHGKIVALLCITHEMAKGFCLSRNKTLRIVLVGSQCLTCRFGHTLFAILSMSRIFSFRKSVCI
jgi:hypothetical protein